MKDDAAADFAEEDPIAAAFEHVPGAAPPHENADGLPAGFRLRLDGVHRREDGQGGRSAWKWLCSPLRVLALPRDRSGRGWGRLVEVTDPDGKPHRWAIPARLFAGDGSEVRAGLMDLGLDLASGAKARAALADLLSLWRPAARAVTADRLGWADETCAAFVLGDGRVIGAAEVVHQAEHAPGAAEAMTEAGTLADWRDTVASACIGNPLLTVAAALAFSGPLLEPLATDGGGLHLRGASSRGKSTALRVAASVWGSPRFVQTWRATSNGLEGIATACNATLLALDEMGEVAGREAGAAAYMLANGVGKARAGRTGAARPPARWRVAVLSSGELSLADKVAEAGGRTAAGQEVRLLDIAATERRHGTFDVLHGAVDGATFADGLRTATAARHGTAGPAFVAALLADREGALAAARAMRDAFVKAAAHRFDLGGEGQTARAAARLGLIAAAGEMATAWGLTGWPEGAAQEAALEVLGLWLDGRGGGGAAEARDAVARVRAFLAAHGSARFEPLIGDGTEKAEPSRPVVNRAGWSAGGLFYVSTDAWREMHAGADPKRAAKLLAKAGFLEMDADGRHTKKLPRSVAGRPRAYAVKAEVMGADDA